MTTSITAELLPSAQPVRFLKDNGTKAPAKAHAGYEMPSVDMLVEAHQRMVVGRRFDAQATALTKQGRLAVYPSSRGQEACEIGGVLALRDDDWLFPTYRDSMALIARGIDPVEALTLLRGSWHCGYDPVATHTAAQTTPLATQAIHAAGVAYAAKQRGKDTVAMTYVGDGGTSEGDFHEALNFAAVFSAPTVFFVPNNRYAISVPLTRQTAAPTLAHKGVGYGIPSEHVDGNDPIAVLAVLQHAVSAARAGNGPMLVEAHTYRIEPHTNADDPARYRDETEVAEWSQRDPIARLETYLKSSNALTDAQIAAVNDEAEALASDMRQRLGSDAEIDPDDLFAYVYAEPTPQLREQRSWMRAELAAEGGGA